MMLSIAFSFFYITFFHRFHEFKSEKLHFFNSHKLVSRPRPRTLKTKTETVGIKTETKTKTLKIGSRDLSRPRLKSRELQVWVLVGLVVVESGDLVPLLRETDM